MVKVCRRASFAVLTIMLIGLFPSLAASQAASQESVASSSQTDRIRRAEPNGRSFNNFSAPLPLSRKAARSCRVEPTTADRSSQDVVDAAYCQLLRRLPEEEGLSYWGSQLDDGLPVVRLISTIQLGEEYRRRTNYSMLETLSKVTISEERAELLRKSEAKEKADSDLTQLEMARVQAAKKKAKADAARRAAEQEAKRRAATLMKRNPISVGEFNRFVSKRRFSTVEYLTPSLAYGTYNTRNQKVNVLLVHLSGSKGFSVSPGDRAKSTVGSWAIDIGAQAAINGNWFDPYDGPAVSSGKVYGGKDHGYTSLFGITLQKDLIMEHHSRVNSSVDRRIAFGVSGHPTLVHQGNKTVDFHGDPTFTSRAPRSAMGASNEGDVLVFVTVDGRSKTAAGMTGAETANLMARLGASNAVMLDGGGSTTMWIAGRGVVNKPSTGQARPVANQIAIFGS